jgi:hypothetical protein
MHCQASTKLGEAFFLIQQNILESDWDLIKLRFAEKILSEGPDARYLMTFGGSSVTAGHDNGINMSYPLIVNRRMQASLAAAGVDLQVHNIAQGANNCMPSNMCYESMGGHDPDFVGWEQSFNCGHDEKVFELPARFAAWSKTPGSVFYSNSGSINPTSCNKSEFAKPWSDEDWEPSMEGLAAWAPTSEDVKYWRGRFHFAFTKAGSSSQRFGGRSAVYREYGVAVLGQDLWGTYRPSDICDVAPEMAGEKCSPATFYSKCLMKMMRKEAAAYGMGRGARHHPGKGMHQTRGEMIAFLYQLIFLDALYDVKAQVSAAGPSSTSSGAVPRAVAAAAKEHFTAERAGMVKTTVLRAPVACGAIHCETKPHCHTDYRSHFSEDLFLHQQMVGRTKWTNDDTAPRHGADVRFHEARHGYFTRSREDGDLSVRVKVGDVKFVYVCSYHYPNAVQTAMEYYLELNVAEARLTEEYVPVQDKLVNWETDTTMDSSWGCMKVHNLPEGQHVLVMRFKENEKKNAAGITHLITWD